MTTSLEKIIQKINRVQLGVLRCENGQKFLLPARAGSNDEVLNCLVDKEACTSSLLEKNVSLIQKDKEDYLYTTCRVTGESTGKSAKILSMTILKASWFTRRSKGNVTWLQQKHTYQLMEEELAS